MSKEYEALEEELEDVLNMYEGCPNSALAELESRRWSLMEKLNELYESETA